MFSFYDDGKGNVSSLEVKNGMVKITREGWTFTYKGNVLNEDNGIYHLDGKLVTPNDDRLLSKVPAEITNESDFLSNVNTKMSKR